MIIDLNKRYGTTFYNLMMISGYKKHPNDKDYIRKDNSGRFHIKYQGENLWDLHYDIDVEWRHFSMNLPERCGRERKRIIKKLYTISSESTFVYKEKKVPQTYADVLRKQTPQISQVKKVKGPAYTPPNPNKPQKFKPSYANPAVVKAELARIKLERELIHTTDIDQSNTPDRL